MHKELFDILAPLDLPIIAMSIFAVTFVAVLIRFIRKTTPIDDMAALPLFDDEGPTLITPAVEVKHG